MSDRIQRLFLWKNEIGGTKTVFGAWTRIIDEQLHNLCHIWAFVTENSNLPKHQTTDCSDSHEHWERTYL